MFVDVAHKTVLRPDEPLMPNNKWLHQRVRRPNFELTFVTVSYRIHHLTQFIHLPLSRAQQLLLCTWNTTERHKTRNNTHKKPNVKLHSHFTSTPHDLQTQNAVNETATTQAKLQYYISHENKSHVDFHSTQQTQTTVPPTTYDKAFVTWHNWDTPPTVHQTHCHAVHPLLDLLVWTHLSAL